MMDDPCFSCTLPDCDERSDMCAVRRLNRSYNAKRRRGEHDQITDTEREAMCRIFEFWKLDRAAEASEGGRPYKRGNRIIGEARV